MDKQVFNAEDLPWTKEKVGQRKTLIGSKYTDAASFHLLKLRPKEQFQTHEHSFLQALYFTSGTGILTVDDEPYDITPGLTAIVFPNQYHSVQNTGNDEIEIMIFESYQMKQSDSPFVDF